MRPPSLTIQPRTPNSPDYQKDPLALYHVLATRAKDDVPLRTALRVLEGALRLYTADNLALAFNGGKDATVVLHILRAVVAKSADETRGRARLHCMYLLGNKDGREEFPAVEEFVHEQVRACGLDGVKVEAGFKDGIRLFIRKREGVCAFVMGTRRDDPHGKDMEHFEPSSEGWPPFMRVNPILSWGYADVWRFLRELGLPYCSMYDEGYTSIGSVASTAPNPALLVTGGECGSAAEYKPAWTLADSSLERAGRISIAASKPSIQNDSDGPKS